MFKKPMAHLHRVMEFDMTREDGGHFGPQVLNTDGCPLVANGTRAVSVLSAVEAGKGFLFLAAPPPPPACAVLAAVLSSRYLELARIDILLISDESSGLLDLLA